MGAEANEALFLVACVVLASLLVRRLFRHLGFPAAVGYVIVGVGLRLLDDRFAVLSPASEGFLGALGELGVAALLFRVGLESDPVGLLRELPIATRIWSSDVGLTLLLGILVARLWGLSWVSTVFAATALSATSVGLSVVVWEEMDRIQTRYGARLLDAAELDDLSAVLLVMVALAIAPALYRGSIDFASLGGIVGRTVAGLVGFGVGCFTFSRYLERRLTARVLHGAPSGTGVLWLVGLGFGIAALAGWFGIPTAVGALFAGLSLSRDPDAIREEHSFEPIHALFTPFFFVAIGLGVDVDHLGGALVLGGVLLVPAVLGKSIGAALPLLRRDGVQVGVLMGLSMVPRAEICLVVARLGSEMGDWAVPPELYGALVFVSAVTAVISPIALQRAFQRWPDAIPAAARGDADRTRSRPGLRARRQGRYSVMAPRAREPMKSRDTRDKIFEAALAVCAEHGYHRTRIDEIVRVAGVSKGGLYHHFKSKRELFLQLFDTLIDRTLEEAGNHAPDATTAEAVHQLFAGFADFLDDERMVRGMVELNMLGLSDAEVRERFAASYRTGVAFAVSLLERGKARGEVDPDLDSERVAWAVLPGADGLVFMHLMLGSFDRVREALADYEVLFLRAITPRG